MLRIVLFAVVLGGCAHEELPALTATRGGAQGVAPRAAAAGEADYDRDGFVGMAELCPMLAGVAPDGCPERDRDGDGFLDSADECPDEPGIKPKGCPIPDLDGDRILDPDDKCVDVPEHRNGFADTDGCPEELPEDLAGVLGKVPGVTFSADRAVLKSRSHKALDRVARVLAKYPEVFIKVSGHTLPGKGDDDRSLSERRAAAVKEYLVKRGVDPGRIEARGAGSLEPVDIGTTAAGRAKNERVEVNIRVERW